jgi:glutathione S-transferase
MLKVHHLSESRSHRVLWLLEELGLDYDMVCYQRDPETWLAPPELKEVHPLGKSPVLEDDGRVVAESGAIIDYLVRHYGGGRLAPDPTSPAYDDYVYWLHYAEGSAMLPIMLALYIGRLGEAGEPLQPRIDSETAKHLDYIEHALRGHDYIVGENFTGADIQMTFVLEAADRIVGLGDRPTIRSYLELMHSRPAYKRALAQSFNSPES